MTVLILIASSITSTSVPEIQILNFIYQSFLSCVMNSKIPKLYFALNLDEKVKFRISH